MTAATDLTAASWRAFSTLLDRALELPPPERIAWLDTLGAEHAALKPALRAVLERGADVETLRWLDTLPRGDGPAPPLEEPELQPDARVGPYRLLRELGVGGMGAVWLAERADGTLKRQVALKLPRAVWSAWLAQRMARERDILASLEHPNIARLYDAGTDAQGRPFLALEYVEGQPIDVYCRERALGVRERVTLLLLVARAVAFAHSRLVIHRDLKPSNILVTGDGQVRLLDFGIAKLMEGDRTEETKLTQTAGQALTLEYASPEQIRGESLGTASDVYSLGVVSYELLAGAKPYKLKRQTAAQLEDAIEMIEAPLASATATAAAVRLELKGDLDAILNKALKKNPNERYATASSFADDGQRWLRHEPVVARRDTTGYRLRKFVERNTVVVGASAAILTAIIAGAGAALWQASEARREAARAHAVQEFVVDLFRVNSLEQPDPLRARQTTARQLLDIGAARVSLALANQPEVELTLLGTLSGLYNELGLYAQAEQLAARQESLARQLHGDQGIELARALVTKAYAAGKREGRAHQAVEPLAEAERLLNASGDYKSLFRAQMHNVAAGRLISISVADARRHAEASVSIHRRYHSDSLSFADALDTLARIMLRQNEWDAAAERIDEALDVARKQRTPDARLARLAASGAQVRSFLGHVELADVLAREALALSERANGERHPSTTSARVALARHLASTSRAAEARSIVETALAHARMPEGKDEPSDLSGTQRRAFEIYWSHGDLIAARALLQQAFRDLGPSAPDKYEHADLLLERSLVESASGDAEAARQTLETAAAMATRLGLEAGTPYQLGWAVADALQRYAAGQPSEAADRLERLRQRKPGERGLTPRARIRLTATLTVALVEGRRNDEARRVARETLAETRTLPEKFYLEPTAALLVALGRAESEGGDCQKAIEYFDAGVAGLRQVLHPDSPWRAQAEAARGLCLVSLGRRDEARAALEEASRAYAINGKLAKSFLETLNQLRGQLRLQGAERDSLRTGRTGTCNTPNRCALDMALTAVA